MIYRIQSCLQKKIFLLLGAYLISSTGLNAQITPHSALKNFKLPKYNENSYRAYTLCGTEGIYDTLGYFRVTNAELSIYSGDEKQVLQTLITSDQAEFDLNKDIATGNSLIEVKDEEFYLKGRNWNLDMKNRRITIESEGTIRFYQDIDLDLTDLF